MIKRFLPWLRRDWQLADDAGKVLRFMSTQINLIGASVVGVQIYAGVDPAWIWLTLAAWVALAAVGAMIAQPELCEDGD